MSNSLPNKAVVISSSRRFVSLLTFENEVIEAKSSVKALEISVGDQVSYERREQDNFITEIAPRKNELIRSYRHEQKVMATNLDHILAVTAVGQSFNTLFLDRVLAVANSQSIPCTILVNKLDQGLNKSIDLIEVYKSLNYPIFCISAKFGIDLEPVSAMLANPEIRTAALLGVSGVGKSTLLNRYIPGARARTQEVNERTGLGRQTTTQSLAHIYNRDPLDRLLFVDMPGLQSFGVSHLQKETIAYAFPEIVSRQGMCEFSDCSHIRERVCAVRQAAEDGEISPTRYLSYLKMIEEIEEQEEY